MTREIFGHGRRGVVLPLVDSEIMEVSAFEAVADGEEKPLCGGQGFLFAGRVCREGFSCRWMGGLLPPV